MPLLFHKSLVEGPPVCLDGEEKRGAEISKELTNRKVGVGALKKKIQREMDAKEESSRNGEKGGGAVHLRREIGLLPAVSFIIGTVVGSGIFIAPKGVLMNSGSVGLSLLVWGLSGVLSLFGKPK